MPETDTVEPTLAAMHAATEAARAANHCACDAPRDTGALYDRTAALYDLLCKTEQLAEFLQRAVLDGLTPNDPPPGLYSDDELPPAMHAATAAAHLEIATARIRDAHKAVNDAWSRLGHLGTSA